MPFADGKVGKSFLYRARTLIIICLLRLHVDKINFNSHVFLIMICGIVMYSNFAS